MRKPRRDTQKTFQSQCAKIILLTWRNSTKSAQFPQNGGGKKPRRATLRRRREDARIKRGGRGVFQTAKKLRGGRAGRNMRGEEAE
ncbi:MAG: hypothetical protein ACR2P5_01555 [Gammaproteobacteria bacterium]